MQTSSNPARHPFIAMLMSAALPGWGQLYNGELNKAIWWGLGFFCLTIPSTVTIALYLPPESMLDGFILNGLALLALWLSGMVDAWQSAKRKSEYQPYSWQHSGVYVLVFLLSNCFVLPIVMQFVRKYEMESFLVPSGSMEPTILTNEMFFADKRYNCPGCKTKVQRGDIAIFVYPNDRNQYFIKRIIGLPGEKIKISGTTIYINGKPLTLVQQPLKQGVQVTETDGKRSWNVVWSKPNLALPQTEMIIPSGHMFALGDNRSASHDSRFYGAVPLADVIGKARFVWLSVKGNTIRWERMGHLLP